MDRYQAGSNLQQSPASRQHAPPRYAGFWRRAVAYCLDGLVMGFMMFFFSFFFGLGVGLVGGDPEGFSQGESDLVGYLIGIPYAWLYYALMESSSRQATLGKMALRLAVTDLQGRRLSFGRATARYFGKLLSMVTLGAGFLMVALTSKKQGLHDMVAGCLVLQKQKELHHSSGLPMRNAG